MQEVKFKKNIGLVFPFSRLFGGTFQYTLSITDSLINFSNKFNYTIIHYNTENLKFLTSLDSKTVNSILLSCSKTSFIKKLALFLNLVFNRNIINMKKNEETSLLKDSGIDILIIPYPSLFGFRNNTPYIVSIPDLMYKYYPNFPEYPLKEKLRRNIEYKNAAKHSVFTVVDSRQGVDDLHKFLKIPKKKCRIIPFLPPGYIYKYKNMDLKVSTKILQKYNLPEKFVFYPAQFWSHKNHARLLYALELIQQKYHITIPLVLVGSPQESYKTIIKLIRKLNLTEQVTHLGYVTDIEIVALYKKSLALIFPSLIGPTSIPPLEAMVLGTPVVCSNLFSMPEQIGDAGLLFDPFNIEDIARKIYKIWTNENLRVKLITKGHEITKDLTPKKYAEKWESVIEEAFREIKK